MKNRLVSSLREITNLRTMTQCALLIALHLVLNSFSIFITPTLKFTVAYVALAAIALIAGPVVAFFSGGIVDVLGYLLHPGMGALHPGITLTTMLTGFVMGLFLYQRDLKLWRVIVSRSIVSLFLNFLLNTYWISTLVGKAYMVLLPQRVLKTLILFPIEVFLIFLTLKTVMVVQTKLAHNKNT